MSLKINQRYRNFQVIVLTTVYGLQLFKSKIKRYRHDNANTLFRD